MKKVIAILFIITGIGVGAVYWWVAQHQGRGRNQIVLYGNVDLREVDLAFNGTERIKTLLVREGDRVRKGEVLGTLQKKKLEAAVDRAEALVDAQRQVVEKLVRGTRPEEKDQARANLDAAKVDFSNARRTFERLKKSAGSGATSQQDSDNAKAAYEVAKAKLLVSRKALELALLGPRKEDVAQARAMLVADRANLALASQDLAYATLICPTNGVVENRVLEPGDMASPQKPAFTIAITDPKWVRAYVPETELGKIRPGMRAIVTTDSFPGKRCEGWVGFISPVASFTPKAVETTQLRTSLVYEVRIFVKDPADQLRLGMPATVHIPLLRKGKVKSTPAKGGSKKAKVREKVERQK